MIRRAGARRLIAATGLTVALLAGTAGSAVAKTFDVSYDWNDGRYGFAGWRPDNSPPGGSAGGNFYTATQAQGNGLRIRPTGNDGNAYKDARGTWTWDVPPGASIRRVRLDGLSGKAIRRQFGRVWIVSPDEAVGDRSAIRELSNVGAPGPEPTATWENRSYTLNLAPGRTGTGFVLWLFTIPCESMEDPAACQTVAPGDGAEVALKKAVITVDDPSRPTLDIGGVGDGTTWTNSRRVTLRASASDPQSGVARVDATIRSGGEPRAVGLGRWTPDRYSTSARLPGQPQLGAERAVSKDITVASSGTTRIDITTVNGAGMKSTVAGRVRVDRSRPEVDAPSTVRPGSVFRASDQLSGVASATLSVDGQARDTCSSARSCRLRVPSDVTDGRRVTVTATDRAGNARSRTRTARVKGAAADHTKPRITWPSTPKVGSTVSVADSGTGIATVTLTTPGTDDVLAACASSGARCSLKIPASVSGKQARVVARDRAGNESTASRKVRGLPVDHPVPTGPNDDDSSVTVRNVRISDPAGNPFSGEATIEWADPILAGSDDARSAKTTLYVGRVQGGTIPRMTVPLEAIDFGRSRRDASINLAVLLNSDAEWSTNEYLSWDLGEAIRSTGDAAEARAKGLAGEPARPVPLAVKPLRIAPSVKNPMLENWGGARSRGPSATTRAAGAKCNDKKWRVWLQYPRGKTQDKPVSIFEAHTWSGESFTFDARNVRSVSTSVIIEEGGGFAGITVAGTAGFENTATVETGAGTKPIDQRYRGFIQGYFDVTRIEYFLADKRKFENWQHTHFHKKGDPTMPHGDTLQEMQCPGKPSRTGHAVVSSSSGVGYTGKAAAEKGRDGYVRKTRGGDERSSGQWDVAPAQQRYLKIGRQKAYTVTSGFKVGTAVGSVSLTQSKTDESGSVVEWKFTDHKKHYFGGASEGGIRDWPVVYAGQKQK